MLATHISYAEKYNYLEEKFKIGFEFLRRTDLASLPEGAIELEGGVIAQVQHYETIHPNEGKWETHDKHFDIQYVIEGQEFFGVVPREGLEVCEAYDESRDITFYEEPLHSGVLLLKAGDFALVAPEDAHKPRMKVAEGCFVKKIVVKVKV